MYDFVWYMNDYLWYINYLIRLVFKNSVVIIVYYNVNLVRMLVD